MKIFSRDRFTREGASGNQESNAMLAHLARSYYSSRFYILFYIIAINFFILGDAKAKVISLGLLDMSDALLARLFAPGLTPWVMSPGQDLILWSRQLNHIVKRMSEALQKPYNDFVEEIVFDTDVLPEVYQQLFDGNVYSKVLREEENFTPSKK